MNSKETLKNLHKTFPAFDLDTLFKILDCYVEDYRWNNYSYITYEDPNKKYLSTNPTITC